MKRLRMIAVAGLSGAAMVLSVAPTVVQADTAAPASRAMKTYQLKIGKFPLDIFASSKVSFTPDGGYVAEGAWGGVTVKNKKRGPLTIKVTADASMSGATSATWFNNSATGGRVCTSWAKGAIIPCLTNTSAPTSLAFALTGTLKIGTGNGGNPTATFPATIGMSLAATGKPVWWLGGPTPTAMQGTGSMQINSLFNIQPGFRNKFVYTGIGF